ncbi:putative metalloprotease CJM1_0395 family protein [Catenovulum sediminis]|uniref:Metalloprotease CJM1_0395 family protein n=1 Tax=Catenovulum sediminis TaxID=1740262 RepID=A0ABV1RDF0_9ALTE|nr:putative metalloprotease CJM1_0395 family protein [Catenovulum sediminis]
MNIVTQFPINLNLNFANPQTEAARKEALSRELITQTGETEQQANESGVGSERERAQARGLQQPLTYEFPRQEIEHKENKGEQQNDADNAGEQDTADDNTGDNADDNAEQNSSNQQQDAQNQQPSEQEQKEIDELQARDREVKTHEQAHASIGGQYASAPSYEYEQGPDGKKYAVGGEVQIDVSVVNGDPQATIRKMEQVKRAALAPAEPSSADRNVANEASQKAQEARVELQKENIESISSSATITSANVADIFNPANPEIQGANGAVPNVEAKQTLSMNAKIDEYTQSISARDESVNARALRIQKFYNTTSVPSGNQFTRYA